MKITALTELVVPAATPSHLAGELFISVQRVEETMHSQTRQLSTMMETVAVCIQDPSATVEGRHERGYASSELCGADR